MNYTLPAAALQPRMQLAPLWGRLAGLVACLWHDSDWITGSKRSYQPSRHFAAWARTLRITFEAEYCVKWTQYRSSC